MRWDREPIVLKDACVAWHVHGGGRSDEPVAYARGYANAGSQPLEDASLSRYVQQVAAQGAEALRQEIPNLNGGWALVVVWPDGEILAAVDRMRTIPLFFYHKQNAFAIADSADELARRYACAPSTLGQVTFLLFGYATGDLTLFDDVRQIRPGESIHYRPDGAGQLTRARYYRFYPPAPPIDGARDYAAELGAVVDRMFQRFSDGYRGERVLIPLSGGMDSRLVAGMLKRIGIDDCVCFTYGEESSEEARLSRQVAEALGYEWRCIQYAEEACAQWSVSDRYREYVRYACKGVSKPNDHDFVAVLELAEEGLCGPNAIFYPGHSADMNAGSHIPPDYPDLYSGRLSVVDEIIRHHANLLWYEPEQMLRAPVAARVIEEIQNDAAIPPGHVNNPLAACEMWNANERQAKYIINCVRTYEFVGSRWRTLWDYEFMDFFLQVPDELRYGQRVWLECLNRHVFVDDLAPLAEIPVAGYGPLKSLTTLRGPARPSSPLSRMKNAIRRRARWHFLRAGFQHRRSRNEEPRKNAVVRLREFGITDGSISFQNALDRTRVMSALSPEIRDALRPWFPIRLDSVPWFAVYGVLTIAEALESAKS